MCGCLSLFLQLYLQKGAMVKWLEQPSYGVGRSQVENLVWLSCDEKTVSVNPGINRYLL